MRFCLDLRLRLVPVHLLKFLVQNSLKIAENLIMKSKFNFAFFLIIALPFFCLAAEYNGMAVPDSSGIRSAVAESWFYSDINELRSKRTELRSNSIGQNFQVRMEESGVYNSVIVAPETFLSVDVYTENGATRKTVSEYPADACGSWVLMRDSRTGKPVHVRFYFAADSDVYVQFAPSLDGKKSTADFVIDGCFASRGVPVGVKFDYFYTASFSDVLRLTEKSLPWRFADIHPDQFSGAFQMIGVVRKNLPRIKYQWDACYDENNKPVKISDGKERFVSDSDKAENKLTLSEAGFVKWLVDGLVEPQAGSSTYLNPLLRATTSFSPIGYAGIKNQKENLSFTLDWTRNLAAARLSIQTRKNYLYEDSGVDVKIEPFSSEVTSKGITSVAGYIKNTGYEIRSLKPVLYVLAATEPTYFYLAAVRRRIAPADGKPEYYVFDQCAAVFPYFDKNKQFGCVVFENGTEMTLSQFTKKYPDCYVHLVRVLSSDRFFPN